MVFDSLLVLEVFVYLTKSYTHNYNRDDTYVCMYDTIRIS